MNCSRFKITYNCLNKLTKNVSKLIILHFADPEKEEKP